MSRKRTSKCISGGDNIPPRCVKATMSRKRTSKCISGEDNRSSTTNDVLGWTCLPMSSTQLRELWAFDNECAVKMGAPFRTCSAVEEDNTGALCDAEFTTLKNAIQSIWQRANGIFEIFRDPKRPDLGFRLRVKPNLLMNFTFKSEDAFYLGWCATAPSAASTSKPPPPCSHLYKRSPVKPGGYMGGPASYCNWAPGNEATAKFTRPINNTNRHLVRLECKDLSAGTELVWDYGSSQMNIPDIWFQDECCSVLDEASMRLEKKCIISPFINTERCVLCGETFSNKNKENKVQRKPHFVNSHADYFGSDWDASDKPYMQEEVDGIQLLLECDKLNYIIHNLKKDMNWNVIPACTVMTSAEIKQYGENSEALMEEFKKRCKFLRNMGTIVMRGMVAIDREPNLSPHHLIPIETRAWRVLSWSQVNGAPRKGHYGVPKNLTHEQVTEMQQSALFNFCIANL